MNSMFTRAPHEPYEPRETMAGQSAIHQLRERRRAERDLELVRPDTRTSILIATERLLGDTPLHDISVAHIMDEAQVSRGTFYSYFSSKFEVTDALLEQTMAEMYAVLSPAIEGVDGLPTPEALYKVLVDSTRLWQEHRAILRATHENWHAVPELRERWLAVVEQFTNALATELDRERDVGLIPPGRDHRQRVAAVLWATEHLLYVAGSNTGTDLAGEETIVDTLMDLWSGVLYPGMPEMRMGGRSDA
jgi:AcrR family transcriptional regulator